MNRIVTVTQPDTQHLIEWIDTLRKNYPEITPTVYGRSKAGRPIFLLSIGTGKENIFYSAGFHGSEWITVLTAMRFFEDIVISQREDKALNGYNFNKILKAKRLVFMPCVNPDGTEISINGFHSAREYYTIVKSVGKNDHIHWNANAAGIDINHNFDAGWEKLKQMELVQGIKTPSPTRFGGLAPESEPETRAVTTLCRQIDFSRAMALHSQGEEIYWEYGENTPAESRSMALKLAEKSGYTLVENSGLASHGGFKDWFIDELKKPAFTIELGKGENPIPLRFFEGIYEKAFPMLAEFAAM